VELKMVVGRKDAEIRHLREQVASLLQRESFGERGSGSDISDSLEGRTLRYSNDGRPDSESMSDDGVQGIGRLSMPARTASMGKSASMDLGGADVVGGALTYTPERRRCHSAQYEGAEAGGNPTPLNAVTGLNPSILHLMQGANRSVMGGMATGSIDGSRQQGPNAVLERMGRGEEARTSAIRRRSIERQRGPGAVGDVQLAHPSAYPEEGHRKLFHANVLLKFQEDSPDYRQKVSVQLLLPPPPPSPFPSCCCCPPPPLPPFPPAASRQSAI
jgi:hypothetical protein